MTLVARLTWQVPDATAFARSLAERLGTVERAGGLVPGAHVVELGDAVLEIRPWIRESPTDDPRAAGRLMLEPVPGGDGPGTVTPALPGAPAIALAGVGWATVELDRAEAELEPWIGGAIPAAAPTDPHLGATARVHAGGRLPGERFVLLEPMTEGRVAASLALDSEGPCAVYLRPADGLRAWSAAARARGVRLAARRIGPLGASVLVLGGPVTGPHLLLVDDSSATLRPPVASTIAP